jgi:hypothetical protein
VAELEILIVKIDDKSDDVSNPLKNERNLSVTATPCHLPLKGEAIAEVLLTLTRAKQ